MTPETKNFINLFTFDQSIQAMQKWINDNPVQWQECLKDDWQIVLEFIRSCKSLDWLNALEKNGIKIPPQTNQNFWLGLEGELSLYYRRAQDLDYLKFFANKSLNAKILVSVIISPKNKELAKQILDLPLNWEARGAHLYTPLLAAAAYYPELITLMCCKEPDVINQADFEGVTLLHRIALQFEDDPFLNLTGEKDYQALKEMYLHLLDILILNKADPTLKVSWGSSVLDLAKERAEALNDMDIYKKISSYLLKTKEAELFSFAGLLGALAGSGSPLHNTLSSSASKDNGEVDKNELSFHS